MNQVPLKLQHRNTSSATSTDAKVLKLLKTVSSRLSHWKWLEAASCNPNRSKREASSRHLVQRGALHMVEAAHKAPKVLKSALRPSGQVSTPRRHSRRVSLDANIAILAKECQPVAQAIETVRTRWNRDELVAIDFDQLFESYESAEHSFALEENMSTWFSELRKARPSSPESAGTPRFQKQQDIPAPTLLPTILE
ncbi:hypothetical protein T484DRAFT_1754252 [Baffinella frigidus]|nr:hypothetical protein T484DRAFT_1754252 [Cryptophyta sp. CCMP2293]